MTPYKQLYRHKPEEGLIGDCWRTSLGCLLDIPPSEVPHLIEDCWEDSAKATEKTKAWLATKGFSFFEVAFNGELDGVLGMMKAINPGVFYLLGGQSRTDCGHSVVCLDDAIIWDPSLTDAGIVGPMEDGYYWITVLIPLSMVSLP